MSAAWIQTYSGRRFFPLDPRVEDIDIVDIAHALAMKCRFGGHAKQFYSVAQHSVLLADHCPAEMALLALMHDAHEAYSPTGDVPRPIKETREFSFVDGMESLIDRAIAAKFDIPYPIKNKAIAALDTRILLDERDQVMVLSDHDWGLPADLQPLGVTIEEWGPYMAREKFLNAFDRYSKMYRMLGRCA